MAGVVLFILGAVGLALMARGIAGRRVGEEPRCRGCRYDLSGIHTTAESCPECGSSLNANGAMVRGLRKRRLASIAVGLLLMSVSLGFVGVSVWAKASDFDFNTIKPTWMLLRQATNDGRWDDTPVARELMVRLSAGSLSESKRNAFARLIVETEPAWLRSTHTNSAEIWDDVFIGVLIDPNTPTAARERLSDLAIRSLTRESEIGPIFEPPVLLSDLFDAMDFLLATGQLKDQHAVSFLHIRVLPHISFAPSSVKAEQPICAQLTFDWSGVNTRLWRGSGLNRLLFGNPWYSVPNSRTGIMAVCTPIATDAWTVESTGEVVYVSKSGDIEQDWAIPQNKGRIERNRPPAWQSFNPQPVIDVAYLAMPDHHPPSALTFEVRITLLKSRSGQPGGYLDPDESSVSIVHRIVVPFEIELEPEKDAVLPAR